MFRWGARHLVDKADDGFEAAAAHHYVMKAKLGTALDRELLRRARAIAAHEGKRLNQVIEEALSEHLRRKSAGTAHVAARTAGCLKLAKSKVDRVFQEEPGILDR